MRFSAAFQSHVADCLPRCRTCKHCSSRQNYSYCLPLSVDLLSFHNKKLESMQMFGHSLKPEGKRVVYVRRLYLVHDLIGAFSSDDWAAGIGMIAPRITNV
jgi:hypothetical protein